MSMQRLISLIFVFVLLIFNLQTPVSLAQLDSRAPSSFSDQIQTDSLPLPLEQAFPFYVSETGPGRLRINWTIAEGHYLYRHAFKFSMRQAADGDSIPVEFTLPDGRVKTDQFFGQIEAYYDRISVNLNLTTVPGAEAFLVIQYQGCADWGFCYPPQRTEFKLVP